MVKFQYINPDLIEIYCEKPIELKYITLVGKCLYFIRRGKDIDTIILQSPLGSYYWYCPKTQSVLADFVTIERKLIKLINKREQVEWGKIPFLRKNR